MRNFILLLIFISTLWSFASAQSPLAELKQVQQIKLLESGRDDVIKILLKDSFNSLEDSNFLSFFMMNTNIEIEYSTGNCANYNEDWNVPQFTVTAIRVTLKNRVEMKDAGNILKTVGIEYSKLKKERLNGRNNKSRYVYFNKESGISIITFNDFIKTIVFSPASKNYSRLCSNEEVQKYYAGKKWNRYPENKKAIIEYNERANVIKLDLDRTEITAGDSLTNESQIKISSDSIKKIKVSVTAEDLDDDPLTYKYVVSAGKIIGQGKDVLWDLSGVKAGEYTILAGVDDGCGICGATITKTVVVKECADCSVK